MNPSQTALAQLRASLNSRRGMEQMPVVLPDPPMNTTRPRVAPWGENMEQMPIQMPGSPPVLPNKQYPNMEQMPTVVPDGTPPYRVTPGKPMPIRGRGKPMYTQPIPGIYEPISRLSPPGYNTLSKPAYRKSNLNVFKDLTNYRLNRG